MEVFRLADMMNRISCKRPEPPTLDKFEIFQTLGKGAYGVVYHVRSKIDNKYYALKQIEVPSSSDGVPQNVLRELSIMQNLSRKGHPNILGLRAVFHGLVEDNCRVQINLVLEKCDWDLYSFLRDIPKLLPEHQCRYIAMQMLYGLDFLHSNNIVHRDLKPQNILINRDQTVKIADFGLSRTFNNTSAFTTLVVTLWYRSPEILLQSYYDSSADIWAAGCIISEIFCRCPLYAGQNEADQIKTIIEKSGMPSKQDWPQDAVVEQKSFPMFPKRNVQEHNKYLTPGAADLITKCLAFNRLHRISAQQALEHVWIKPPVRKILKPLYINKRA